MERVEAGRDGDGPGEAKTFTVKLVKPPEGAEPAAWLTELAAAFGGRRATHVVDMSADSRLDVGG